jgi:hypothetical protein
VVGPGDRALRKPFALSRRDEAALALVVREKAVWDFTF